MTVPEWEVTPVGAEILVNTTTALDQFDQEITTLAGGGFVITWRDNSSGHSNIRAQVFAADGTPLGGEMQVNTTTSEDQSDPQIAALEGGGFVITWQDNSQTGEDTSQQAVRAQVFAADGTAVGGELLVNTTTPSIQGNPQVTQLAGGGFTITWSDWSSGDEDIRAQVFAADGTSVGGEILVNTTTSGHQSSPEITALTGGGFVITWQDSSQTGGDISDTAVRAQAFAADGTSVGEEILVNTTTTDVQFNPNIAPLAGGGFVIIWEDASSGPMDIRGQIFAADGTPAGGEFVVNATTVLTQWNPQVAALEGGGFVVTWHDDNSFTGGDISPPGVRAQVFAADGTPVGGEFQVNTTTSGGQGSQQITALEGGGFVITWEDWSGTGGDTSGRAIRAQVFAADGTPVGEEFLVNTTTPGHQWNPEVTALPGGGFAITWTDGSTTGTDVRAQVFEVIDNSVNAVPEATGNDAIAAPGAAIPLSVLFDWSDADGIEDIVSFMVRDADLGGGYLTVNGVPVAEGTILGPIPIGDIDDWAFVPGAFGGGTVNFLVIDADGAQSAPASAVVTTSWFAGLTGDANDNLLVGAGGNDNMNGNGGNDTLLGGAGNDTLRGGPGDDIATGGAGADTFVFKLGDGTLTITDFEAGTDKLAFAGLPGGFKPANLLPFVSQVGDDVVIATGGQQIVIENTLLAELGGGDVIFV